MLDNLGFVFFTYGISVMNGLSNSEVLWTNIKYGKPFQLPEVFGINILAIVAFSILEIEIYTLKIFIEANNRYL